MYYKQNNLDAAVSELRLELANHPDFPSTYKFLAEVLDRAHRKDETLDAYRKWLQADPSNRDAALKLSILLTDDKKDPEALDVLQKAVKLSPDSASLEEALAGAYLRNKQTDAGLAMLKKALADEPTTMRLNSAAFSLAEVNFALDQGKEWADLALRQADRESLEPANNEAALTNTRYIGYIWDTVGWVYFRLGQYDQALPYIRASWLLSQSTAVGDHLAQVYEKLGKKTEAVHTYRLAIAADDGSAKEKEDARKHYEMLIGQKVDNADAPFLTRNAKGTYVPSPSEELSRMRTTNLTTASHETTSAVFTIVFSKGKVEEVKYVSGSESLKSLTGKIEEAKYKVEFPDSGPSRLYRRGLVACGRLSGCDVALLLPSSVHTVDVPAAH